MSTVLPQYPFDPTGLAASNRVIETVAIKSRGTFDYYFIVPRISPFYADEAVLKLYPVGTNPNNPAQGQELVEGKDYAFGYHFAQASHTIGKAVYGAISFFDRTLEGQLRMELQTLGGEWVLDDQAMNELLLNIAHNPRRATWEQVVELPHQFPVVNHDFSVDDFVGMSETVDQLGEIERAILQANEGGLKDHIEDTSNPHGVTKAQVGLGLVDNFPTATIGEATGGTANNRFMTPLRTKQLIDAIATASLNLHLADLSNPHGVTKAQVGLGSVQNLALAGQAEAEAGASNARYMTPVRTREAIEAIVGVRFNAHVEDHDNPHQVTKSQVGLGNVPNIGIAQDNAALQGVDDSGIITPRLLAMVIAETIGATLTSHALDINNPHAVTKGQVGLSFVENFPPASEAEARDATAADRYMTPLAVRQAINELVGDSSNAHVTDYNNPHQVTAAQVGAYSTEQSDVLLQQRLGRTETAANADQVYGFDQDEMIAWIASLKAGDASKFDGKTYAEVKADILSLPSGDASKFDGKTYPEVVEDILSQVEPTDGTRMAVPALPATVDGSGDEDDPIPLGSCWVRLGTAKAGACTLLLSGGKRTIAGQVTPGQSTMVVQLDFSQVLVDEGSDERTARVDTAMIHSLGLAIPFQLGYTVEPQDNGTVLLGLYTHPEGPISELSILELSEKLFSLAEDDPENEIYLGNPLLVEPTDIQYFDVYEMLDKVDNFATATPAQTSEGTSDVLFVTPVGVNAALEDFCSELIAVVDEAIVLFE